MANIIKETASCIKEGYAEAFKNYLSILRLLIPYFLTLILVIRFMDLFVLNLSFVFYFIVLFAGFTLVIFLARNAAINIPAVSYLAKDAF